jgi:Rps23 Pro-64 3,4-dihydroxylase Tpa1-like proline 4-hydroxylase
MDTLGFPALSTLPINLAQRQSFLDPFPHFQVRGAVRQDAEGVILDWLETESHWSLTQAAFYEQHEFSLLDCDLPDEVRFLTSPSLITYLKEQFSENFDTLFDDRADVTAHRLTPGQIIKIHNDYIQGRETHRLLIQLNRSWEANQGGLLILFSDPQPEAAAKFVIPESRSAFGFEISSRSLHAVSTIKSGSRFTLVYSFYGRL